MDTATKACDATDATITASSGSTSYLYLIPPALVLLATGIDIAVRRRKSFAGFRTSSFSDDSSPRTKSKSKSRSRSSSSSSSRSDSKGPAKSPAFSCLDDENQMSPSASNPKAKSYGSLVDSPKLPRLPSSAAELNRPAHTLRARSLSDSMIPAPPPHTSHSNPSPPPTLPPPSSPSEIERPISPAGPAPSHHDPTRRIVSLPSSPKPKSSSQRHRDALAFQSLCADLLRQNRVWALEREVRSLTLSQADTAREAEEREAAWDAERREMRREIEVLKGGLAARMVEQEIGNDLEGRLFDEVSRRREGVTLDKDGVGIVDDHTQSIEYTPTNERNDEDDEDDAQTCLDSSISFLSTSSTRVGSPSPTPSTSPFSSPSKGSSTKRMANSNTNPAPPPSPPSTRPSGTSGTLKVKVKAPLSTGIPRRRRTSLCNTCHPPSPVAEDSEDSNNPSSEGPAPRRDPSAYYKGFSFNARYFPRSSSSLRAESICLDGSSSNSSCPSRPSTSLGHFSSETRARDSGDPNLMGDNTTQGLAGRLERGVVDNGGLEQRRRPASAGGVRRRGPTPTPLRATWKI